MSDGIEAMAGLDMPEYPARCAAALRLSAPEDEEQDRDDADDEEDDEDDDEDDEEDDDEEADDDVDDDDEAEDEPDNVEEAGRESFPASDPPALTISQAAMAAPSSFTLVMMRPTMP